MCDWTLIEDCCMEKAAVSCVIRVVEDCCMEKAAVSCVIHTSRQLPCMEKAIFYLV